jgi:hypothetical protein
MKDLCKGNVLALAPWAAVLAWVEKLMVDVVMHGTSAEENPYCQVEIGFKKVQYPQCFQLDASGLFIYHDINDVSPAMKVESVVARCGGKSMDDTEDLFGLISNGNAFLVDFHAKFTPGVNVGSEEAFIDTKMTPRG